MEPTPRSSQQKNTPSTTLQRQYSKMMFFRHKEVVQYSRYGRPIPPKGASRAGVFQTDATGGCVNFPRPHRRRNRDRKNKQTKTCVTERERMKTFHTHGWRRLQPAPGLRRPRTPNIATPASFPTTIGPPFRPIKHDTSHPHKPHNHDILGNVFWDNQRKIVQNHTESQSWLKR